MSIESSGFLYGESTQVLLSSLSSLQRTGDYSDLTIFCGSSVHRVHKAIVCPRSHFFAGACRVGKEALKNEVSLPDDEPSLVALMVDYLYQLDYEFKPEPCDPVIAHLGQESTDTPEPKSPFAQVVGKFEDLSAQQVEAADDEIWLSKKKKSKKGWRSEWDSMTSHAPNLQPAADDTSVANENNERELCIHAQMYALADKYGIYDLKNLARDKFEGVASRDWNGRGFPLAVEIVYSSTPESDHGLRDVVVNTISAHKELLEKVEVEALVKQVNGLAFGLLKCAWDL